MKSWNILALVAFVAFGCGKKKEPESVADGAAVNEITLGVLDLDKRPPADGMEQRAFVAHLQFKNILANAITVNKME